jgi:NTP pyrophosphatase (non-canonical NTP hydrolase)
MWAGRRKVRHVSASPVQDAIGDFVRARDWDQFHSPVNLAKSIAIEAAELLECFQWSDDADPSRVKEELADVLTYCHMLAMKLGLDTDEIVLEKLAVSERKYPVNKARGRSLRYDELPD